MIPFSSSWHDWLSTDFLARSQAAVHSSTTMDLELYKVNESQWFNMNCTNFTIGDWKSLNLVRSVAAIIGVVVILAILSFLIYYKSYSSLFQRLYLYLIVATLLNETAGVVSIEHQWRYARQETVCVGIGFVTGWTYVLLFIFSYEIIFYLLYLVVSKIRGAELAQCSPRCIRCCSVTTEIIFIVLPALVSTAFVLPPYLHNRYGIAGPWCFVQSLNSDCEPTGKATQMAFYGMYMALGFAGIVASLIFSVVYFKLATSFRDVRRLLKRTLCVLVFKFVHILLILCSVACRLYTLQFRRHQLYGLWLTHALSVPIGVLLFPFGYLLCFHPVGKIVQRIYMMVYKRCKRKTPVEVQNVTAQGTAPKSTRVTQPSHTFFEVPHPSDIPSERSPLINNTGYGSTMSMIMDMAAQCLCHTKEDQNTN